jgi:hypothetical protein
MKIPVIEMTKTKQSDWEIQTIIKEFNDWCLENKIPIGERMKTETIMVGDWWIKKVELLLTEILQAKQEGIEEAINWVQVNQKGTFTDEAGHDCWYIDDLVKALKELKKKAKLNKIIGGR